jgi:hypothetical protein
MAWRNLLRVFEAAVSASSVPRVTGYKNPDPFLHVGIIKRRRRALKQMIKLCWGGHNEVQRIGSK